MKVKCINNKTTKRDPKRQPRLKLNEIYTVAREVRGMDNFGGIHQCYELQEINAMWAYEKERFVVVETYDEKLKREQPDILES